MNLFVFFLNTRCNFFLIQSNSFAYSFWLCPLANNDIPSQMGRYKNYSFPQESDGDDVSI